MSSITDLNLLGPSTYGKSREGTAQSTLDMETFLRLLSVQLSTQNPLEPMSDRDFFAQMAQLGQVQGMDSLKKGQDMTQAQNLVGKSITALRTQSSADTSTAPYVMGTVEGFIIRNGEIVLQVQEADGGFADVKMDQIQALGNSNPVSSIYDFANFVGQDATGIARVKVKTGTDADGKDVFAMKDREVTGRIESVRIQNGQAVFTVNTTEYGKVQVSATQITGILARTG